MQAKLEVLGDGSNGNGKLSGEQAAALAAHPAWQRSGFEPLERFIFEFLTGGNPAAAAAATAGSNGTARGGGEGRQAGAESVRLKLEVRGVEEVGGGWLGQLPPGPRRPPILSLLANR